MGFSKRNVLWISATRLLLACVAPAHAQPRDRLAIGMSSFPSTLQPFVNTILAGNYLLAASRRLVTRFDQDGRTVCQLCTEVPTVENGRVKTVDLPNGGKGMEVTFTLRADLKWGDGTPLTSNDIVFGAEVQRFFGSPANVEGVAALDNRSYTVKLNALRYDFDRLSPQPVNAAIEAPILHASANPLDYASKSAFARAPDTPGLWDGPYLLTDFKPNQSATFTPNPYWDGEKPAFRQVVMRVLGNSAALQANLLSGDIDMANGLSIDQALDLQKRYANRFDISFPLIADWTTYLYFQNDSPILRDKRVRQAIMLAIDRQTIVDRLFGGKLPVAKSILAPVDPSFDKDLNPWPFDPSRARALLTEAGYKPGTDGIMVRADGTTLSLDLLVPSGNRVFELLQQVIQSELRQIGIEVVAKSEIERVMLSVTARKRLFTGMMLDSLISSPDSIPFPTFGSIGIPSEANAFTGYNFSGYSNPSLDAVMTAALSELDPAKRQVLWNEIQATVMDNLPQLPLYNSTYVLQSPDWMTGLTPRRSTYVPTLWIEYWKPR